MDDEHCCLTCVSFGVKRPKDKNILNFSHGTSAVVSEKCDGIDWVTLFPEHLIS